MLPDLGEGAFKCLPEATQSGYWASVPDYCICSLRLPPSLWLVKDWLRHCVSVTRPQEDPSLPPPHWWGEKLIQPKPPSTYLYLRVWTSWTTRLTSNTYWSFTTKCERVISGLGKFWDKTQKSHSDLRVRTGKPWERNALYFGGKERNLKHILFRCL